MMDYLAMGGYAVFIWPSYALSALVLGGLVVQSFRSYGAKQRQVAALEAQMGGADQPLAEAPKSVVELVEADPKS